MSKHAIERAKLVKRVTRNNLTAATEDTAAGTPRGKRRIQESRKAHKFAKAGFHVAVIKSSQKKRPTKKKKKRIPRIDDPLIRLGKKFSKRFLGKKK